MKKIVASVGLVALGASGIQNASAQELTNPDTSKPWSVGLTLRGFYDDNTGTIPNDQPLGAGQKRDSFGYEVSPTASLVWALQQTTINLGVLYAFRYYENIPPNSTGHDDNIFTFSAGVSHAFSEQLKLRVSDSFVVGQEPDLLRAGNTFSTFERVSGDNIRNYGTIALDAQLSPQFGLGFGYDNAFYDYKAKGPSTVNAGFTDQFGFPVQAIAPSTAGVLNRMENRAHLEGLYSLQPETKALLGYQFTDFNYTGDELIGGYVSPFDPFLTPGEVFFPAVSSDRNNRQHTMYVGAEHTFAPELTGSLRVGASYTDYYNDPNTSSTWTPYVNGSLKYTYAPESYVQGGLSYDRNATDLVGLTASGGTSSFTTDAQSFVIFASVNHRLTPQLFGSLIGQFQNSLYNGGAFNNDREQYYLVGVNLEYRFNQYFSANAGYNFDDLQSHNIGRTFDRNRVYIGVTASY